MRIACIDCGSNTTLLLVAEKTDKGFVAIEEKIAFTRLGEGLLQHGFLQAEPMRRTLANIKIFIECAQQRGAKKILLIATEAVRSASNRDEFLDPLKKLPIETLLLSGEQEAQLGFAAVQRDFYHQEITVIDIGGASTEISIGDKKINSRHSFPIGVVRMTEQFLQHTPPTENETSALRHYIAEYVEQMPAFRGITIGISGTMTTLAAIDLQLKSYDDRAIHGHVLSVSAILKIVHQLENCSVDQRAHIPGLDAKRADVLYAGALLSAQFIERAPKKEITVSTKGIRWGALYQYGE